MQQASGVFWASTDVARDALRITGEDRLTWYRSSEKVRRGFCSTCGSFLFWAPARGDMIAISMGAFEAPTSTRLAKHFFVACKGDYYDIADGLQQNRQ
jgi:hypothetical protein